MRVVRAVAASLSLLLSPLLLAQSTYSTGFEAPEFTLGNVAGQNGWGHLSNSPTRGEITPAPPGGSGGQSLAIVTNEVGFFGVANHLWTPVIDPAGETGSTLSGVVVQAPRSTFQASFWYRTPSAPVMSAYTDGRIAELNPSSRRIAQGEGGNRYVQVRVVNTPNTAAGTPSVQMRWYLSSGMLTSTNVAQLAWGAWYRFEYIIQLVDGLDGIEANDRVRLNIYSSTNTLVGTACGSTWELAWRSGGFGGGASPRAINGFDFWSLVNTNGAVAGHIDELTMSSSTPATPPLMAAISGPSSACAAGVATLTASSSGGHGPLINTIWRNASNAVVGGGPTFNAPPGTYTATVTDSWCTVATSAPFEVTSLPPLSASISGNTSVCFGGTTTLTANSSGGSGTIDSYTWRNAADAIVGTGTTLVAGAGTYTVTANDASCGSATSAPVTVEVTCKATPVVTWSDPAAIVYGTPLSAVQLNASANVPGSFVYTPPAGTILNAGTDQPLSVDFIPADSANYNSVNGTVVHIDVLQATPAITISGGPFAYDGSAHAATVNVTNGSGTPVSGTISVTYDGSATAPVNAGTYAVVATFTSSDPNYTNATGNGTLVIQPATPVVTVTGGTFVYDGAAHPASATVRNANGAPVSGATSITYNGSAIAPVNAGTYAVVATFTSSDPNYTNATGNATLTIGRATPIISWSTPAPITYGTLLTAAQLNATANVPGTFTYTPPAGTRLDAGPGQQLSAEFTPTDTTNYRPVTATVLLTVYRAPTTTTITSITPEPSALGQPVTVRFQVGGLLSGTRGTVTITDDVDFCTTSAGAQSCTFALRTAGTRMLYAVYSGDANHLDSSSSAVAHQVTPSSATATLRGSTSICAGASAALTVELTGTAPWTITWSDGVTESVSSNVHVRTVNPPQTATYTIASVRDASGAGTASGAATVTVTTVPPPSITASAAIEIGKPVTLRATAGYTSYQWFRNGVAIGGATGAELTIASVASTDLGAYSVSGARDGCVSAPSTAYSLVPLALPLNYDAVIPVVGTTRGAAGSLFRTTLHLVNPSDQAAEGEITFVDPRLPKYSYRLGARESRFIEDLLPASFDGLTSANVRRLLGPLPIVVAHVFNDATSLGTSGLIERLVPVGDVLAAGDAGVLVTPIDSVTTRFNVGLRALDEGATLRITRRAADGRLLAAFQRVLTPSTLVHEPLATLLGANAGSSESLTFEVTAGRAVVYGAATDNGTNDPNLQLARRMEAAPAGGRFVLPVAGAIRGAFDSRFATGLQIHNPTDQPLDATLTFHPGAASGSGSDPRLAVRVPVRGTLAFDDVVAAIGGTGLGSVDVVTSAAVRPVLLARVYSIAPSGQTSLTTELVREQDALVPGEEAVLVASHAPRVARFNIGVRTLASGARVTATIRRPNGQVAHVATLVFAPASFAQESASALLGYDFAGDESVTFTIVEGSAVIYGVWTDNVTQDPALQYAVTR